MIATTTFKKQSLIKGVMAIQIGLEIQNKTGPKPRPVLNKKLPPKCEG